MAFKAKDESAKCRGVNFVYCEDALKRIRERQAEEMRTTGRRIGKGQAIEYILLGK